MKVHEYEAKKLMVTYDIPVPKGGVAESTEEAKAVASEIGVAVLS